MRPECKHYMDMGEVNFPGVVLISTNPLDIDTKFVYFSKR